jgi:hypothetical protein
MLGLATTSGVGQTAAGIHLVDVRFRGDTQLEAVDLRKCAADLESRLYEGPEWLFAAGQTLAGDLRML